MKVILLIDDDVDDHETIKQAFYAADANAHCICFTDCDEALTQLSSHTIPQVDCVLVDLHMPRTNGIECLKALKRLPGNTDVDIIMISSLFREGDLEELCRHGAKALWIKPNTWAEYQSMAQTILTGKVKESTIMRV